MLEGVVGISHVVEAMHGTIQRLPMPLARARPTSSRGLTRVVYRSVRGGMRGSGWLLETLLEQLERGQGAAVESNGAPSALGSVVNGLFGDHLHASGSPLAIPMQWRLQGRRWRPGVDPAPTGRSEATGRHLLLCVHGLCLDESHWSRRGHDHGLALAETLGTSLLYLRYNTGRSIAENGRELSAHLEELLQHWPDPKVNLHVLAHSMGGLVARAALHAASPDQHWPNRLRSLVSLGTPHAGAPLERLGSGLQRALGLSPYSAPLVRLGAARSTGITDLRFGRISPDDAPVRALPAELSVYTLAGCLGDAPDDPKARLLGDGLVPVRSALGDGLRLAAAHRKVVPRTGHLQLLASRSVHDQLLHWLRPRL